MLSTLHRRTIATCSAALLVLGLVAVASTPARAEGTTFQVSGNVFGSADGVSIRFYRATGNSENPWELTATTRNDPYNYSYYAADLVPGTYRATFNELQEDSLTWDVFKPRTWTRGDTTTGVSEFEIDGLQSHTGLGITRLQYRGGRVSLPYTDQCTEPTVPHLRVTAFAADDPDLTQPFAQSATRDDFQVRTFGRPTKFKVGGLNYPDRWVGGDSFATATTFDPSADELVPGPTLQLMRTINATGGSGARVVGQVLAPNPPYGLGGKAGIVLHFYRSESATDGPWVLAKEALTAPADGPSPAGKYNVYLEPGYYRMAVNDIHDQSMNSKYYAPTFYNRGSDFASSTTLCATSSWTLNAQDIVLARAGGSITGTLTDRMGKPAAGVTVAAFDPSDADGASAQPILSTTTDASGKYSIDAIKGGEKLRFTKPNYYDTEWSGDSSEFDSATTISAAPGTTSEGNDAVLEDTQVDFTEPPSIGDATPRYNETLTVSRGRLSRDVPGGVWTYQWFRTKDGKTYPISGATSYERKLTSHDVGARLSVRVTITPPPSYPTMTPVSSMSEMTDYVRRLTHVIVTGTAKGLSIKVVVTVKVNGVSYPKGKVRLRWVALKASGNYLYPTGTTKTAYLTYTNGKAYYTINVSKKGYWAYAGYTLPTTTTTFGESITKIIRIS